MYLARVHLKRAIYLSLWRVTLAAGYYKTPHTLNSLQLKEYWWGLLVNWHFFFCLHNMKCSFVSLPDLGKSFYCTRACIFRYWVMLACHQQLIDCQNRLLIVTVWPMPQMVALYTQLIIIVRFWNAAFFHAVHTERKMRVRSNKWVLLCNFKRWRLSKSLNKTNKVVFHLSRKRLL